MQLSTKGIRHFIVTCALICFWTKNLQGQAPDFLWAKQAVGTSAGQAIAKDAAGNVFVVGRFYNSAVFGSTTLGNASNWDVFVAKYDGSGSLIWIRTAGGVDEEFGADVAVDASGNVYIVGTFNGSATFGSTTLTTSFPFTEMFIAKYDNDGVFQWAKQSSSVTAGKAAPWSLSIDGTGNLFVTGTCMGVVNMGGTNLTAPFTNTDIFVASYNASGGLRWAVKGGSNDANGDIAWEIATTPSGDSFVTGYFYGSATFSPYSVTSAGNSDIFVAKYDASGNVSWLQRFGGSGYDEAQSLALDNSGNIFTGGSILASSITFGSTTLTATGRDAYIAKLDATGTPVWAIQSTGPTSETIQSLALDGSNNIFFTARIDNAGSSTFGTTTYTSAGDWDYLLGKYNSSGSFQWLKGVGGPNLDYSNSILIDAASNLYTTGAFYLSTTYGTTTLSGPAGGNNFYVAKLGTPVPPVVSSFAPASGPIGTSITITGSNFSSTPANNIVYFGAVKGTVTAATSTQLTVTVPAGASFKPISVNVAGLTGFSTKPFRVTFTGGALTANSFSCPVGRGGEDIGDIDGDGKPDYAYIFDYFDTYVNATRNLNDPGAIILSKFETPVSYLAGNYMTGVRFVDFDGDGKLDLAPEGRMLRNKSTAGTFSATTFAAYATFVGGTPAMDAEYLDMDGDGKVDAVATEFINIDAVFIRRNISTPGSITAASFAPQVDIASGTTYDQLALDDVDQDGKPDMIVSGPASGGKIAVFRNISTPGAITAGSFEPRVEFPTGSNPVSLASGDLDGDGKPEMIVANGTPETITVFPNTSTPGTISFGAPFTIATAGKAVEVSVGDLNGDGKLEILVSKYPTAVVQLYVSIFKNIHTSGPVTSGSFDARIDLPYAFNGVYVNDVDGDGKPDIFGTGRTIRNMVGEPELSVSSMTPSSGGTGSSVTITGTNFDPVPASNIVRFNTANGTITSASATSLVVTVPGSATTGPVTITVGCKSVSAGTFTVTTGGITVSSQPTNRTVCDGATTTFSVSASGPSLTYQWQLNSSDISNGGGYSGVNSSTLTVNTTGNFGAGTYRCRISSTSASSVNSSNATLTINPTPATPTTTGAFACSASSLTLRASGGTNGNYRWYSVASGGTAISGALTDTFTTPVVSASTTYYVSVANASCESTRAPALAEIKSCAPQIAAAATKAPAGGTTTLSLTSLVTTVVSTLDVNSFSIITPPLSGAKASILSGTLLIDYTGIPFTGTDRLTIRACDMMTNCGQQDITVEVAGNIVVYNAVSANGDGKNDIFFIEYIDVIPDAKENKVTIFNRWGDSVFEAVNYDNKASVFAGAGKSGDRLPAGTYYYKIEFASGRPTVTGFISLKQ